MIKVGLTGGIGTGKSTVSKILLESGFCIIDADQIAKDVLSKYPEILIKVRDDFGDGFFDWRGEFRRKEFGNHIFRFPKQRIKYENIIMPYIIKEINDSFDAYNKKGVGIVILDAPTLIENNMHEEMDFIILVWSDSNAQLSRLKLRDKLSQSEALNRINAQLPLDRKKEYANFIIDNSASLIKTKEQVDDMIEILKLYK
ncbi:dephospho-CoA kinase [Clostridium folliculivorans]|uniref:Dephospho-CoA kinase n=1 Tax=Clostridium folliculivorans TaxID=2886038 RepID=A0A9W6DB03_9CLOT|nr:dephospho-CoA kinase [Clostridium folliculivorans]GKU25501.1 dephospho-CoA kinase [Clostridium folliculivorans]GKU28524.1 dephospho-CoA kinase [Clostridium folliculivorans]